MRQQKIKILWGFVIFLMVGAAYAIRVAMPPSLPKAPQTTPKKSAITDATPKPASPSLSEGSYLHPTSTILGEVSVAPGVFVGPRASLRADIGHAIVIREGSNIQDGAVLWGLPVEAEGKALPERSATPLASSSPPESDVVAVSVYVGEGVSVGPQAQIVGPSWIDPRVYIGAGALVFHSKIGAGSIIEPGAKLMNVEVPAGSLVRAGQIITNPEISKRLAQVEPQNSWAEKAAQSAALYTRLTAGYLGQFDAEVSAQQKEWWTRTRKEPTWMPGIPLKEAPEFAIPGQDEQTQRDPSAVLIGGVNLKGSVVGAGSVLRADQGRAIEAEGAMIFEGVVIVASQGEIAPPPQSAPASTSAPASAPNNAPASAPASTPSSLPLTQPAEVSDGVVLRPGSILEAGAQIYGPALIGEGATIGYKALVVESSIGARSIVSEGAVVFRVQIPEGKLVPPGVIVSSQEAALSLPSSLPVIPESMPTSYPSVVKAPLGAPNVPSVAPLATLDATSTLQGKNTIGSDSYVADRVMLLSGLGGEIQLEANVYLQSASILKSQEKPLRVGAGSVIASQALLAGATTIGESSLIGPQVILVNSTIGAGAIIEPGAILLGAKVPEGGYVSAGTVAKGDATFGLVSAQSSWTKMKDELTFLGRSFAAVYSQAPRKAELRGKNARLQKEQAPKEASGLWEALFTEEGVLFLFLGLLILGMIGYGVRQSED